MKHVTVNQLADILLSFETVKGMSIFAGVTQLTDISNMRKTNNPYVGAKKLSVMQVMLNTDYEKGVVNQLAREGKEASEYKKGANTMPLIFGENNQFIGMFESAKTGKYEFVLQYRPKTDATPKVSYLLNGQELDYKLISPFIPERKKAENQGTDKEILWRKVYLSNILNLNFNNEQYQLIHTV
jgi:hypothetical protein